MTDAIYVRGWDDCLEVLCMVIEKVKSLEEFKSKMDILRKLVKEEKFDKIRYELGAFDIF